MKTRTALISSAAVLMMAAKANAGCSIDVGYRVQYSDLALLHWVQLEVLDADSQPLATIDNTTRAEWEETDRAHTVKWTIPSTWADGYYVIRAHGNASFPCVESGMRQFCTLELEDRETIYVQTPETAGLCPPEPSTSASTKDPTAARVLEESSDTIATDSTVQEEKSDIQSQHVSENDIEAVRKLVANMKDYDLNAGTYTTSSGSVESLAEIPASTVDLLRAILVKSNSQGLDATALLDRIHQNPQLLDFTMVEDTSPIASSHEFPFDRKDIDTTPAASDSTESTETSNFAGTPSPRITHANLTQTTEGNKTGSAFRELVQDLDQVQDKHPSDFSSADQARASMAMTALGSAVVVLWMALNAV
ncbi:hypothetical protein BGW42_008018 [Actinomortierella wolfii]|nr:hypothetical protein BGW42_008018 [Actinomortierella wolfii]